MHHFVGWLSPLTSIVSDGFSVAFLQFRRPEFMSSANTNTASSCPSSCASPGTAASSVRSLGRLVWTEVSSSILTHNAAFWLAAYRHIFFYYHVKELAIYFYFPRCFYQD